jgi:hypothetical protein
MDSEEYCMMLLAARKMRLLLRSNSWVGMSETRDSYYLSMIETSIKITIEVMDEV